MSEMSIDFAIKVLSTAKVEFNKSLSSDNTYKYYDKARTLAIEALKYMKDNKPTKEDINL